MRRSLSYSIWLLALALSTALFLKSVFRRDLTTIAVNGIAIAALLVAFHFLGPRLMGWFRGDHED